MTYTVNQAMAVAMFNAGVKEEDRLIGLPVAKAKDVVRFLHQMGFDIDATRHAAGDRHIAAEIEALTEPDTRLCTRKDCGKPQSEHERGVWCP